MASSSSNKKACTTLSSLTEEDNTILERLFEKYGKMVLEKELHYKHVSSCTFINMLPSGGAGRHILKMVLRMLDRESFYMFVKTSFIHQFCKLRSNNLLNNWCKYKLKYYGYENNFPDGTPFIVACQLGRLQDVKLFVQNHDVKESGMTLKEMVNETWENADGDIYTALEISRLKKFGQQSDVELINFLIDILYENSAVNVLVKKYCTENSNGTPLMLACQYGNIDDVRTLISNHDINESGITLQQLVNQAQEAEDHQTTALKAAGGYENDDIVDYLVDSAYKNTALNTLMKAHYKDNSWDSVMNPLMYACESGNLNNVKVMMTNHDAKESGMTLKQMVNKVGRDSNGWECTPLIIAAHYEHCDVVKYLIEQGEADPNIANSDEENALHCAAYNNRTNTDLIKCLLENMSLQCINHSDSDGCTPLDNAYQSNINNEIKDEIIQLIRKHGGISTLTHE